MSIQRANTPGTGDAFDELLNEFKNRNQARTNPEYVLENVDTDSISQKYIKLLRSNADVELPEEAQAHAAEAVEYTNTDTDNNKGLTLLSENYTKTARNKDLISSLSGAAAIAVLVIGLIVMAVIAQGLILALGFIAVAVILWIVRRVNARQAKETREIASALVEPEEHSVS